MKVKSAVSAAVLFFSVASLAATVEYQHPDVTIVAVDESLDSVLKSLGKEMNLTVTTPIGVNPVINVDIQNQPIKRAFKNLLGELSYSLVWTDDGERLTGLIILAGDGEDAQIGLPEKQSPKTSNTPAAYIPDSSASPQPAASFAPARNDDPEMAERESVMALEREEQEARMAEERAEQEAEMEQRRQEDKIVQKERMVEERARREAEMSALAESLGYPPLSK
jgi:hypothetical protein